MAVRLDNRQDGFEAISRISACDPIYFTGRSRPQNLKRRIPFFTCQCVQPNTPKKRLVIKAKRLPLTLQIIGQVRHAIVKSGNRNAPVFIMKAGQNTTEHTDRVD